MESPRINSRRRLQRTCFKGTITIIRSTYIDRHFITIHWRVAMETPTVRFALLADFHLQGPEYDLHTSSSDNSAYVPILKAHVDVGSEGFRPEGAAIWPSMGPICCMRGPRTCDMPEGPSAAPLPAAPPPPPPPPPLLAGAIIWVSMGPMACIISARLLPPGAARGSALPWSASNVAPGHRPGRHLSC